MKAAQILIILSLSVQMFSQSLEGTFVSKYDRLYDGFAFPEDILTQQSEVAWMGERIYFHLLLKADQEIKSLEYEFSPILNEQDIQLPTNVKMSFAHSVKGDDVAKSCAGYTNRNDYSLIADALSSDTVKTLAAGELSSLLLSIDIPKEAKVGHYNCTLSVQTLTKELSFNLEIEVIDLILPAVCDWRFHLDIWQYPASILNHYNHSGRENQIELWSDDHFNLIFPAYKMLADAGQKVITAHIKEGALGSPSMIKWIKKTDQTWHYDFSAFDRFVEEMMGIGIDRQISCFSPVGWNEAVIPYWDESEQKYMNLYAPLESEEFVNRWDHFLSSFRSHLVEKNWFDITVLYFDEVGEAKLERVLEMIKANDAGWKMGMAYSHRLSEKMKANFIDLSGIIEDASNQGIAEDQTSTFYTSCTQRFPNSYVTKENSIAEMTWMAFYAANHGFDGYLRWAYDYWTLTDPIDTRDGSNTAGDFSIIYRSGNKKPMNFYTSMRLEMLREGVEEYEKITVLKELYSNSGIPSDSVFLKSIDSVLSLFDRQSAEMARDLVPRAQEYLIRITNDKCSSMSKKPLSLKKVDLAARLR